MRVREWMTTDPVTVTPDTTVDDARRLLQIRGVRHLPVVRCGRLIGIVSDRDLVAGHPTVRPSGLAESLGAGRPLVCEVMSSPPWTVGADDPLDAAARQLLSRRISALPVVDGSRLVGVITTTDCLLALLSVTPAEVGS